MPRSFFRGTDQRVPQSDDKEWRFYQPQFYDPFFFIQGSVPEKRVMAELVRRGIYFEHTPQTNPLEWGTLKSIAKSDPTNWEADFLFPQFKNWLEVQGAYFHTLPGVREKEALRFALIEAAGWRPVYWWDYDIEARLPELMDEIPEFYRPPSTKKGNIKGKNMLGFKDRTTPFRPGNQKAGPGHQIPLESRQHFQSHHNQPRTFGDFTNGLPFLEGGEGVDHLKGLRNANAARATTPQYGSKYRSMDVRRSKIRRRWSHS